MTIYYLQETHFIYDSLNRLKVKRWEKIHHANINQKKAGVAMLILSRLGTEKINYQTGHYVMIKGSILQEDITI